MTDDLQMFISLMCRKIGLQFEKNVTHDGLHSLRFVPPANAMGAHDDPNTERRNEDNECYCRKDQGFDCYKSGVLNMAPCKATPDRPDGAPIALSYPHFYQVCLSHRMLHKYVHEVIINIEYISGRQSNYLCMLF